MRFKVSSMTCGHCVRSITRALQAIDADAKVRIDLATGIAEVDGLLSVDQALSAMAEQGYPAEMLEDEALAAATASQCCGTCHA